MQEILNKYYLPTDAKLVYSGKGRIGVNCWFDHIGSNGNECRTHRALSFKDFDLLKEQELEDLKNECELNSLENQSPEC